MLIAIIIIIVIVLLFVWDFTPKNPTVWGVTFSQEYAHNELGLDWQKTYLAILDDLKVSHLRLSAYWKKTEPQAGQYDFADLDWQINEATKRGVKIILAVGRRLPRWPECHDPSWLKNLSAEQINQKQLQLIKTIAERYRNNPNIIYFQVENEPFLRSFGQCPALDKNFIKKEVKLIKQITGRPILVTDSGELSTWLRTSRLGGDVLGSTLYRVVYNPQFGYWRWFLPPSYYYFKAQLIKAVSPVKKVIIAELQTEAWHKQNTNLKEMSVADASESLSLNQFKKNIAFSRRAGFREVYLWGVEWWYFLKENQNYGDYWNEAKKLWQK